MPGRLDRIEAILQGLAERQDAFEGRLDRLTEQVAILVEESRRHTRRLDSLEGKLGNLEGEALENRYHNNARNWYGSYARGARAVTVWDLEDLESAVEDGRLSQTQFDQVKRLDLIARGRDKESGEVTLYPTEISVTINVEDIRRAEDAAAILRIAGYRARAFAGGYRATRAAQSLAEDIAAIIDLHRPTTEPMDATSERR